MVAACRFSIASVETRRQGHDGEDPFSMNLAGGNKYNHENINQILSNCCCEQRGREHNDSSSIER
jgi:hypothetical protein